MNQSDDQHQTWIHRQEALMHCMQLVLPILPYRIEYIMSKNVIY